MTATDQAPPTFRSPSLDEPGAGGVPREADLDLERGTGDDLDPLANLAELAAPVALPDVLVPHRLRPGWAVLYSTEVDLDDVKRWRKRAKAPGKRDEVDEIRLACIVLANLCRGLQRNGVTLEDDAGPLTFASQRIWQLYNADKAADAVRRFYGNDPYLVATTDAVLAAAGVGEEVETMDPTQRSSD